jgi:AraC-like DNA-binding protein
MGSGAHDRSDGALWDIARPALPGRVPGMMMAGFEDRGLTPPSLRLIPHPSVTVVLPFNGTISVQDTGGRRRQGGFVTGPGFGQVLRALHVEQADCLQIRLSPVVAQAALGVAVAELDGAVVTLDGLWGREAARLGEKLAALTSWEERFASAEAWLARRCAAASRSAAAGRAEVAWAWREIVASRGTARIERLAAELGWSRKRLWSRFHAQLGLPPKRAAKLVRFDHAVHGLAAGRQAAEVAAERGYADQSHLHRDVMAFTGLTPTAVADEPFVAIDDIAWGWPAKLSCPRSRPRT